LNTVDDSLRDGAFFEYIAGRRNENAQYLHLSIISVGIGSLFFEL
jgi:hypothetical protein